MWWKRSSWENKAQPPMSRIHLAWWTLEANRHWVAQADTKAGAGLGITGVGIAVVFAVASDHGVSGSWQWFTMAGVAVSGIISIAFALLALVARLRQSESAQLTFNPIFFGDVAKKYPTFADSSRLATEYTRMAADENVLMEALADQVRVTSLVVAKKFKYVNRELTAMSLALAFSGAFAASVALA